MGSKVDPSLVTLYFGLCMIMLCPLSMYVANQNPFTKTFGWLEIRYAVFFLFNGWTAQITSAIALSLERASKTQPLSYLVVVYAWVVDLTFFGASLRLTDLIATILIVGFTFVGAMVDVCYQRLRSEKH